MWVRLFRGRLGVVGSTTPSPRLKTVTTKGHLAGGSLLLCHVVAYRQHLYYHEHLGVFDPSLAERAKLKLFLHEPTMFLSFVISPTFIILFLSSKLYSLPLKLTFVFVCFLFVCCFELALERRR